MPLFMYKLLTLSRNLTWQYFNNSFCNYLFLSLIQEYCRKIFDFPNSFLMNYRHSYRIYQFSFTVLYASIFPIWSIKIVLDQKPFINVNCKIFQTYPERRYLLSERTSSIVIIPRLKNAFSLSGWRLTSVSSRSIPVWCSSAIFSS